MRVVLCRVRIGRDGPYLRASEIEFISVSEHSLNLYNDDFGKYVRL